MNKKSKSKRQIFRLTKDSKLWAISAQSIFAIFIIVAFYALGFTAQMTEIRGLNPEGLKNAEQAINDIGGTSKIKYNQIYALCITGIVIAFSVIIIPSILMFFSNKKSNFILGWVSIVLDVLVLSVTTAAVAMWAHELTADGQPGYKEGYTAGQFILIFVGASIAFCGIGFSYKKDLLK